MEKRYQVFISSTKEDLEDARHEVSQALLRANCFPAAMELFPAADEGIDDYIKQKIDESDYVVLILAGRYGSVNPENGLSYTEIEYNYAVTQDKPVIRLVHADPFNLLPGARIEQDPTRREKLEEFRKRVTSNKIARMWESDRDLGAEVLLGILDAQQRHPAVGWIRADVGAAEDVVRENFALKRKLEKSQRSDLIRTRIVGRKDFPVWEAMMLKDLESDNPFGRTTILRSLLRLTKNAQSGRNSLVYGLERIGILTEIALPIVIAADRDGIIAKGAGTDNFFFTSDGRALLDLAQIEDALEN